MRGHTACILPLAATFVRCFCLKEAHLRFSAGGLHCGLVTTAPSACQLQNSSLQEGKWVFGINQVICINSRGTVDWSYQIGSIFTTEFPVISHGPILQADPSKDGSFQPVCSFLPAQRTTSSFLSGVWGDMHSHIHVCTWINTWVGETGEVVQRANFGIHLPGFKSWLNLLLWECFLTYLCPLLMWKNVETNRPLLQDCRKFSSAR